MSIIVMGLTTLFIYLIGSIAILFLLVLFAINIVYIDTKCSNCGFEFRAFRKTKESEIDYSSSMGSDLSTSMSLNIIRVSIVIFTITVTCITGNPLLLFSLILFMFIHEASFKTKCIRCGKDFIAKRKENLDDDDDVANEISLT
jgi:DNA-directed RNA polymerase subunit RPC12/RpoP